MTGTNKDRWYLGGKVVLYKSDSETSRGQLLWIIKVPLRGEGLSAVGTTDDLTE